jgi:hypothetical protein
MFCSQIPVGDRGLAEGGLPKRHWSASSGLFLLIAFLEKNVTHGQTGTFSLFLKKWLLEER